MAKQLLGTQTTDENGVATFTLTGTGRGKLNLIAESGGLVSPPYPVCDAIVYDSTTNHYTNWKNKSNRLTITADTTGTLLENNVSSNGWIGLGKPSRTSLEDYMFDWSTPFCVEFDILSFDDNTQSNIQISDQNNHNFIKPWSQLGISSACHLKIEVSDKIYVTVDNGTPQEFTNTFVTDVLVMINVTPEHSFKFKDFYLYPI